MSLPSGRSVPSCFWGADAWLPFRQKAGQFWVNPLKFPAPSSSEQKRETKGDVEVFFYRKLRQMRFALCVLSRGSTQNRRSLWIRWRHHHRCLRLTHESSNHLQSQTYDSAMTIANGNYADILHYYICNLESKVLDECLATNMEQPPNDSTRGSPVYMLPILSDLDAKRSWNNDYATHTSGVRLERKNDCVKLRTWAWFQAASAKCSSCHHAVRLHFPFQSYSRRNRKSTCSTGSAPLWCAAEWLSDATRTARRKWNTAAAAVETPATIDNNDVTAIFITVANSNLFLFFHVRNEGVGELL